MMATALIHMDPKQKQRLEHRAKLRGKSFSQEVRDAVEMYLDVPVENEAELRALAKAANHAADRMIKNLDETIAHVGRVLKHKRNGG
jgi:predicted DNA-binding protein